MSEGNEARLSWQTRLDHLRDAVVMSTLAFTERLMHTPLAHAAGYYCRWRPGDPCYGCARRANQLAQSVNG